MATRPNIVFLDEYSLGGQDLSKIKELGSYTAYDFTEPSEVISRAKDADIIITNKVVIDRSTIESLPRLGMICISATGMNNVDLEAARDHHIVVKNAVGYSTHSVAETTIGAAIALYRQIPYYDNFTKTQYSTSHRQFHYGRTTYTIHGANWGIIGLGNIGHEVAKIATTMGAEVRYASTSGVQRKEAYPQMSIDDLLQWADIISIHCPLTPSTKGLIGEKELKKMKSTAIIINVARGGIVDEHALADALNHGEVMGAGLDVFAHEPMEIDNPLLKVDDPTKLVLSPHNAWSPVESLEILVECMRQNISTYLNEKQ